MDTVIDECVKVVGHDLYGQPGGVGGEAPRGEMIEPHAVLQVADGILDLGVAAMVGLEIQGVALTVGDEGVVAVVGKQRQLGPGCQSVLPVHLLGLDALLGSVGPVAGDIKLQDDGVVHDPVNRRGGGHGVGKDALPLREDQV